MKKTLFSLFAVAAMLFATSCSQEEEIGSVVPGTEVEVSFSAQLPEIATRAYSDGSTVTTLHYAVYVKGSNETVFQDTVMITGNSARVNLKLANSMTYELIFWAQSNKTAAYTLDWTNKSMSIDYSQLKANDENNDAFYKYIEYTVDGSNSQQSVVLTRPFAQINLGTNDLKDAEERGLVAEKTNLVITSTVPNVLNFVDGTVSGEVENATFAANAFAKGENAETFPVSGYDYLGMSYILVDEKELIDCTFNVWKEGEENAMTTPIRVSNVPVQRNFRTNIYGSLLTNATDFNITIDARFENPDNNAEIFADAVKLNNVYYETIEEALAVAVDGDVIYLGIGEFDLPSKMRLSGSTAGGNITLEGLGESSILHALTPVQSDRPSTYAENLGITIKNLKYETHNDWLRAGFAHAKYVNFENCTIIGGYHCFTSVETFTNCTIDPQDDFIFTYGALETTFDGCTFNSSKGNAIQAYSEGFDNDLKLTIKDCEFIAAQAGKDTWYTGPITAIEINSIRGNNYIVDITNTTATGYSIGNVSGNCLWNWRDNSADGNYKGTEGAIVTIDGVVVYPTVGVNGTYYKSLEEALADVVDGAVINLAEGTYTLPAGAKGKTLSFVGIGKSTNTVIEVRPNGDANFDCALEGSTVTFENLTIKTPNENHRGYARMKGTYKDCIIDGQYTLCGESSFENCTFNVTGDHYNVWTYGTDSEFNNCTFYCDGKAVLVYHENIVDDTVTFTNCDFNDKDGLVDETKAAIETGADQAETKHTLNINKCTVNGFNITGRKSSWGGTDLGTNVWGNKNLMTADNLNVIIDGTEVY